MLFVHSMLEFPLHYAYFLLPAGLMAGAISQSSNAIAIKIPRLVVVLILAMSTAGYFVTVKDYAVVEGGFLGFGGEKVSEAEKRTLIDISAALRGATI